MRTAGSVYRGVSPGAPGGRLIVSDANGRDAAHRDDALLWQSPHRTAGAIDDAREADAVGGLVRCVRTSEDGPLPSPTF
jgi:hypothetical protein